MHDSNEFYTNILINDIFPNEFYDGNSKTNDFAALHKNIFKLIATKLKESTTVNEVMFYLFPFIDNFCYSNDSTTGSGGNFNFDINLDSNSENLENNQTDRGGQSSKQTEIENKSFFSEIFRLTPLSNKAYLYFKFFTIEINNCLSLSALSTNYSVLNNEFYKEKQLELMVDKFDKLDEIGGIRKCCKHLRLDNFEALRNNFVKIER